MDSCIYEGRVRHSRVTPVEHKFRYRVFMLYLDLDELPKLFERRWFWSVRRPALARFRRSDHLGAPDRSLKDAVCELVERETGERPDGPIRLLTNLSYFGYCFNPVSFYYCYSSDGKRVETIVAEVSNTPWGERDTYVLPRSASVGKGRVQRFRPEKKMHVSPFMPMELDYDWCFGSPGDRLSVYMANLKDGKRFFDAAINLTRTEINGRSLARVLLIFPFMTAKVSAGIYWQALKLWIKRCPIYPHPDKRQKIATTSR
ncbi:MAG: DUF1365 domain-containing protein [Pseudomonadota bacterium]